MGGGSEKRPSKSEKRATLSVEDVKAFASSLFEHGGSCSQGSGKAHLELRSGTRIGGLAPHFCRQLGLGGERYDAQGAGGKGRPGQE